MLISKVLRRCFFRWQKANLCYIVTEEGNNYSIVLCYLGEDQQTCKLADSWRLLHCNLFQDLTSINYLNNNVYVVFFKEVFKLWMKNIYWRINNQSVLLNQLNEFHKPPSSFWKIKLIMEGVMVKSQFSANWLLWSYS